MERYDSFLFLILPVSFFFFARFYIRLVFPYMILHQIDD
jgi:hypothetical protein